MEAVAPNRVFWDSAPIKMLSKNTDLLLAGGVIMILAMMIIPLPSIVLDVLLAANITIAILLPLELSVFPGLLLILTIFRLSLNVASTRLILGEGYAGEVINAFGAFVVEGNYVVGFIIFIILVIIQFIVIVKGAGRIAEVAARFTLDAMPGKQMAIDADMNAGLITEEVARERRREIAREAEFHGAMDGASKFVRGDAVAGLLINVVNIVGGFIIGVVQKGMPFSDALKNYTDSRAYYLHCCRHDRYPERIRHCTRQGNANAAVGQTQSASCRVWCAWAVCNRAGTSDNSFPHPFGPYRFCCVCRAAR
jgi:flagellar biosynthesis protein FlhA